MSGICGIVHFTEPPIQDDQIRAMTRMMAHRGSQTEPMQEDGRQGLFTARIGRVRFGYSQLKIIDDPYSAQPFSDHEAHLHIVFNGEIYNYQALKQDLIGRGYRFRTQTDTEVIVHLYQEYGDRCVQYLRGMFAFAIWDERQQVLFGARDHFGIKPFYYLMRDDQFLFASEIKSILADSQTLRRVRMESLFHYMSFEYVPEPFTMFDGICKLPHGHSFRLQPGGPLEIKKYWDPQFAPEDRSLNDLIEELRERLSHSVEYHMQSDVARGCFLSGGIDSSAIAALMCKKDKLKTFSVGYEGALNEALMSSDTAVQLGTEHHAKMITERDFFDALLPALWHHDEPLAEPSAVSMYLLAKLAKKHVTVVLSGEGSDELFGGYHIYRENGLARFVQWLPDSLKSRAHELLRGLPRNWPGRESLLQTFLPLERRFIGNSAVFSEDMKAWLLEEHTGFKDSIMTPEQWVEPLYERTRTLDSVTRMQYIDLQLSLPGDILLRADKMTMAHALELRAPYLDKDLFELARIIPAKYRISKGLTKTILRKAMSDLLPESIVQRPKIEVKVPFAEWLRTERAQLVHAEIKQADIGHLLRMEHIEQLFREHQSGQTDHARKIWNLYSFSKWYRLFITSDDWQQTLAKPHTHSIGSH